MKLTITDLNNRHKTGLFLTAIAAGLCLFFEDSVRQTLGVILIGSAFAWAFGSANRALRLVVAALGILTMVGPLIAALIDHRDAMRTYEESVVDFEKQLPEFVREHPDLSAGLPPLPSGYTLDQIDRTITVPNVGRIAFPQQMSSQKIAQALKENTGQGKPPEWYFKALEAGLDPTAVDDLPTPRDRPADFSLSASIADGYFLEIPGLLLAILFVGSVMSDRRVAQL
jgi:hypothetical protein